MTERYDASKIQILKGLEAVRKRPSMYIGDVGLRGLHHLIYEVVDNSVDEALAGFCDRIEVVLYRDGSVSIEDNGRGIPVDIHPEQKKPAVEVVLTVLHSGAKFDDKIYTISGGLHGVGISVVNALSEFLEVVVKRDGKIYEMKFERGEVIQPLKIKGETEERGTYIRFKPDPEIFKKTEFNYDTVARRLREIAFLTKGVKFILKDMRSGDEAVFQYENGILDFLNFVTSGRHHLHKPLYLYEKKNGIEVEITLVWTDGFNEDILTFVNTINTHEGGTHLSGFKSGLTRTVNEFIRKRYSKYANLDISGEDIREGLFSIISLKIPNPQFEGQTKTKLGNSEVRGIVESIVSSHVQKFLEENPRVADIIVEKIISAAKSREAAKKARELVRKRSLLESDTLPGKLADCVTNNSDEAELFIVEGDSAGGSAKQGRNRHFQAVLPLRGKILNVEKASLNKILSNEELRSIVAALGSGIGEDEVEPDKVRYKKIIIMTDADVDGSHIRTLLLTFFYRFLKPLIEAGYLYIAQPPLYGVKIGKKITYLYSDEELEEFLEKNKGKNLQIQRYKGLGEMNPSQLWDTTMNPETRILKKVTIYDASMADEILNILLGSNVEPRREFIARNSKYVENLDI